MEILNVQSSKVFTLEEEHVVTKYFYCKISVQIFKMSQTMLNVEVYSKACF